MIFRRYLGGSIYQATLFVLAGFLAMFLFFDFIAEADEVGQGGYEIQHAVVYVLLGAPNYVYELAPIAALIGALWALSQSAARSEYTVFRVSGLMPRTAIVAMLKIGLPIVLLTAIFSELLVPIAEDFRGKVRGGALGVTSTGQLRSGFWMRDASSTASSRESRFINAARVTYDQNLEGLVIYEFDERQRLVTITRAALATHVGEPNSPQWELTDVAQTIFEADGSVKNRRAPMLLMSSQLSPNMLGALVSNPDRMSARDLYFYVDYLKRNKLQSERYEIAFWKRVIYPFAAWVMLLLALPAAYLQARSGAVGLRVFAGILVGVAFHLLNSLFSHLGVLNTWPAPAMAALPSVLALLVAAVSLAWVQRR